MAVRLTVAAFFPPVNEPLSTTLLLLRAFTYDVTLRVSEHVLECRHISYIAVSIRREQGFAFSAERTPR